LAKTKALAIGIELVLKAAMLLSVTTTHRPATDLGYLMAKHPDRVQSFELGFGQAVVVYPEATEERCTMSLILDLDAVALVRGRPATGRDGENVAGPLSNYVNDRPYVASSFMSVAIGRVLGSALGGRTTMRPDLLTAPLPLSVRFGPVRVRGGPGVVTRLFAPLGYEVAADAITGTDGGVAGLWMLTLSATVRLQTLLSHVYVLIPVLDHEKHYWVSDDEIEKLLRHGVGWLSAHPDREFITRRYLARGPRLVRRALERLAALDGVPDAGETVETPVFLSLPPEEPPNLNEMRYRAVQQALAAADAKTVLDLGCGEGKLLKSLLRDKRFTKITGVDVSLQTLAIARDRLNVDNLPERVRERLTLLQSPLTYRDRRLSGYDAAAVVEVVEHIEPERLPAFESAVFASARPRTVVLTTPNQDWNVTIPALAGGKLRHRDHRFEWSRQEFAAWTENVATVNGYTVSVEGIGEPHPEFGCPTQMAVFVCN
jgi:3' terminal RNA ribose 2'-O-methyltransferase Hen1